MKHWPTKPLGEVAHVCAGEPAPQRAEDFSDDGIPFVRMQDVGRFGQTTNLTETKDRLSASASRKFRRFPIGSVLVPKSGASIRLNHRAILGIEAHVVSHLAVVIPNQLLNSRFAYYWLCTKDLSAVAHKADLPSMKTSDLARLEIPLPSFSEQTRIVKLLDEADELRGLRSQSDDRMSSFIPALFNEMFAERSTKTDFKHVNLEGVADVVSGVTKGRKFNGRQTIEVPYLRVANVQDGRLDLSEIKTIEALPEDLAQLSLRRGDVLLTEGGDYDKLGRGAMVEEDMPNCIHQNHIFRVRVNNDILDPVFFSKFLLTLEVKTYFLSCAKRTTNLASINMRQLRALPVMVPPLYLQKTFAQRVGAANEMFAVQKQCRVRVDDLYQSMLHHAFNGKL